MLACTRRLGYRVLSRVSNSSQGVIPPCGTRQPDCRSHSLPCLSLLAAATYNNHHGEFSRGGRKHVSMVGKDGISFLGQEAAQELDRDLMSPELGWSIEQLMELAGLSCACSIAEQYDASFRVLVLAGPGNNGGDGLVAARHLHHFGYDVAVCYPKQGDSALFHGLVTQLKSLGIPFVCVDDVVASSLLSQGYGVVVDGLFGFSFKGQPRAPFDQLITSMSNAMKERDMRRSKGEDVSFAVVCIDVPSGWHVEEGDVSGLYPIHPDMLISLTAPKLCSRSFKGKHHYLGGRFVPPKIIQKYHLVLPRYPGSSQCVNLNNLA